MFNPVKIKVIALGLMVIIFTVIFISWGLDDINGLLKHPARVALLIGLFAEFMMIAFFVPIGSTHHSLPIQTVEDNTLIAFIGAMTVLLFLMISPFSDRREWMQLGGGDTLRYVGVGLFFIGALFSVWSPIHLYLRLKEQQKNQGTYQLITDGPFKFVRHPRDFGGILMFISVPLVFLSALGFMLACFSAAGLLERISREEKILQQQFREEWATYTRRTKCLIPWINRV